MVLAITKRRVTNAFAEGITNKVKVIKRCAYGFRNPVRYRSKVLLACGHRLKSEADHRSSR
jgi:transposase